MFKMVKKNPTKWYLNKTLKPTSFNNGFLLLQNCQFNENIKPFRFYHWKNGPGVNVLPLKKSAPAYHFPLK